MLLRLEPRAQPSRWLLYTSPLIAAGLPLLSGIRLLGGLGHAAVAPG